MVNTVFQLIASLSLLVFIHELGHFFFARLFGARVEKFYLFFHPWFSIFKYQSKRSGTIYGLGWLPLGGYCKIAGMIDESLDEKGIASPPKADEFRSKKAWQRLLIMAGGVIFNLILAILIYAGIAFAWGDRYLTSERATAGYKFSQVGHSIGFQDGDLVLSWDDTYGPINALDNRIFNQIVNAQEVRVLRGQDTVTISIPSDLMQRILASEQGFMSLLHPFVVDSIPRETLIETGLNVGDRVLSVQGVSTPDIADVITALASHKGQMVELEVQPWAQQASQPSRTISVPVDTAGRMGVIPSSILKLYPTEQINYSIVQSIPTGIDKASQTIGNYVGGLQLIFTKEGAKQIGGLGTMGKLFPSQFDWYVFWNITAFLSIILAVMNILPIPALDGGHILFIIIEIISGKKLSEQAMMRIQTAGLIILAALMLYANGNDIYRYLIK